MEQLIIFIIFYIVYGIFQAINKGKKKNVPQRRPRPQQPGPPPNQPRSRPGRDLNPPPLNQPSAPSQQVEPEPPEVELPPFLREMLGMDDPPARPAPPPEPIEDDGVYTDEEHEAGFEHAEFEEIDDAYDLPGRDPMPVVPETESKKPGQSALKKLLRDPNNVRNAILLKEILDKPISKRSGRFPYDVGRSD